MKRTSKIRMTLKQRRIARDILQRNLVEVGEGVERTKVAVQVGAPSTQREHNWLMDRR